MAKQLNLISPGQIVATALHTEMQQSYLEYAMSVIVGRALPDVRDGQKPVHRRILYAMHELGLTPDRPYRKCARVVGDVLGKYHPHGDQAVYDAIVRMVQDFSSRYPLLSGHGNFGSVDNDPPAAMRYTETRLAAIGNEGLLAEVGEATVNFIPNFDDSQQEPAVLPAQLPFLVLNGSSGIAVGMATNVPPHNLSEVVDGLIALIDRPNLSDEELFTLIPAPDFPTGGEITDLEGVRAAYTTGRGSIPVRGVAQLEHIRAVRGRRREAIVITELPYQVNKAGLIEKIAELVNQGRLDGIADVRDESDREGMRIVLELKRESNPQAILARLYKQTPLQTNFGAIFLALNDSRPQQMSLREMLQSFLNFREQTLTRQYTYELEAVQQKLHLLQGMLQALVNLDAVIEVIRNAPDSTTAKGVLQAEFDLSDRQADAILAMPLRRLTGMEQQKLQTEYDELTQRAGELQQLLNNRRELLKAMKKDLRALKRRYGDARRTRIATLSEAVSQVADGEEDEAPIATEEGLLIPDENATLPPEDEETVLELSYRGYARRLSLRSFQRQTRSQAVEADLDEGTEGGQIEPPLIELPLVPTTEDSFTSDFAYLTQVTSTAKSLIVLTRDGKAYPVQIGDVPLASSRSRGLPLIQLLPNSVKADPEVIVQTLLLPEDPELLQTLSLLLLTQQGRIKRLTLAELAGVTTRGLSMIKLKADDHMQHALTIHPDRQLVLTTSGGRSLRFAIDDDQLPITGRTAQGAPALRLRGQEQVIGCHDLTEHDELLMVSRQGYARQIPVSSLRMGTRGAIGTQAFRFSSRSDGLVKAVPIQLAAELVILTSANRLARIALTAIPPSSKEFLLLDLDNDEQVTDLAVVTDPLA